MSATHSFSHHASLPFCPSSPSNPSDSQRGVGIGKLAQMIFEHLGESPVFDLASPMPSDSSKRDDSSSLASSRGNDRATSEASGKSDDGKPAKRGRRSRPKVKTGCSNCKQRRIKCDEARPSCTQCIRGKKECTGYPPPPRSARPEYEVRIAPKPMPPGLAPAPPPTTTSAMTPSPTLTAMSEAPRATFLSREVTLPPRRVARRGPTSMASSPAPEATSAPYPPPSALPSFGTEGYYFQIFQEQPANELSGFFDSVFYKERVLEACNTEPSIRHAAIALGALYKTLVQSWGLSNASSASQQELEEQVRHWHVAVRQYSEACNAMMAMTDPSQNSLRTQLMASVLLASFDSFIGDHRQAIVQIQNGLDLLERIRSAERLPAYGVATDTAEEELTIIFMRLAIQAKSYDLAFHFPEPYVVRFTSPARHQARLQQFSQQQQPPELDPNLYMSRLSPGSGIESQGASPSGSPPPLQVFPSLHEARVAHDRLNERLVRLQEAINIRPRDTPRVAMPEGWSRGMMSIRPQMDSWSEAFQPLLLSRHGPHVSKRDRAGIAVLQMSHLTAGVVGAAQFSASEMVFDDYTSVFQSIVDLGLEIIQEEEALGAAVCQTESVFCPHQRPLTTDFINAGVFSACHIKPTFSMDLGIVSPLFVVATKCRVPTLRRQAIELLRGCARREGMWDSYLTARMGHWIMTLEESTPEAHPSFDAQSHYNDPSLIFQHGGSHHLNQPHVAVPAERRVKLRSVDFDLRARWANVAVGTRDISEGMSDPRFRSTHMTW